MKIIKNEIRPIGYIVIELSEVEIQEIIGVIEEVQFCRNMPFEKIGGIRQEIYEKMKELLLTKRNPL